LIATNKKESKNHFQDYNCLAKHTKKMKMAIMDLVRKNSKIKVLIKVGNF